MAQLLFLLTVLLPLVGGLVLLLFLRGEDRHLQIIFSSVIVALSLSMTLVTIMLHPPPASFCISWLASVGSMCVTFEQSALTLIFLASLPLLLILTSKRNTISSAVEYGFLLIAFSMMQVALVSEHFMLRYVALEFVGLCITAAALLLTSPNKNRWNNTKQVFINLRIGDLALLVAIFLMFTISDSFDITRNFADALLGTPDIQVIISACLLTGIWVKMAIWPLNQWRHAANSIKRNTRIWLLDICAPLLGAYLLYRSVPLFALQQRALFPLALAIGYLAVISFLVRDAREDPLQQFQRSGFHFTSIFLVLSGFWIGQKIVWAFMLLWLLLRVVYLAWYEIESRTRPASTQLADIEAIHLILTHGLSFLLMWHISAQANLSALTSVMLWAMWWTHAISNAKNLAMQVRRSAINQPINERSPVAQRILKVIFVGISIFAAGIVLAERIAAVVKGNGYTIFAEHMQLRLIPVLQRDFWIGLMAGGLALLLARQLVYLKVVAHHILHRFSTFGEKAQGVQQRISSDPLDFYEQAKQIFQKTAEFIYQRFEKESAEKVGEGLGGVFKFLFQTVEGFTSGNLWNRTLAAVLKSSRNLQQMHHGILRFNMVLLLAFIIGVSILVWVWTMNGWV